jgi:hypothetical protein
MLLKEQTQRWYVQADVIHPMIQLHVNGRSTNLAMDFESWMIMRIRACIKLRMRVSSLKK